MSAVPPNRALARQAKRHELMKHRTKRELIELAQRTRITSAKPLTRWSKAQLVTHLLSADPATRLPVRPEPGGGSDAR